MDFNAMRSDARFDREYIQSIKDRYSVSSVIGESVRLIPRGNGQYKACCPFHDDSDPSLSIDDEKQFFNCFGCGAAGDVISYVAKREGVGFYAACNRLEEGYVPQSFNIERSFEDEEEKKRIARSYWNAAQPIAGSPAGEYLESRAIFEEFASQQENLRFARLSFDHSAQKHPALIAAARNVNGDIVAVQRTYLTEEGAKIAEDCKRSLGPIKGAAIRVCGLHSTCEAPEHIYLCEGLEDGLSVARLYKDAVVWVTMGKSNLATVELPSDVQRVTIALDNDEAGRSAAALATKAFVKAGKKVNHLIPPAPYKDWNEYHTKYEFDSDPGSFQLPYRRYISDDEANDPDWEGPYIYPEPHAANAADDLDELEVM